MFVKKVEKSSDSDKPIAVTVEPKAGHTDDEVLKALTDAGAIDVAVLAPGFISATASDQSLRKLETIAHVHPKAAKQMR